MKKLLIGLLALGSITSFANCEVSVRSLETGKSYKQSFDTKNGLFTLLSIEDDLKLENKVNLTVKRTSEKDFEAIVHSIYPSNISLNDEIDLSQGNERFSDRFKDKVETLSLRLVNGSGDAIQNDKFRIGAICDVQFKD